MRPIDDLRDNPQAEAMVNTIGMDNIEILAGALRQGQVKESANRDPDRNVNAINAVLSAIRDMVEQEASLPDTPLDLAKEVAGVLFQHQPERMQDVHKDLEECSAKKEPLGSHTAQLEAKTSAPNYGWNR